MIDLFGKEVPDAAPELPAGQYKRWKSEHHYRPYLIPSRSCGTCVHHKYNGYHKCKLMGESMSTATDITLKSVCDSWE